MLTKSRKFGNYCVTGLNIQNGKLVRLISDNALTDHAVPINHLIYNDNNTAEILDLVSFKIIDEKPNTHRHQPENVLYDSSSRVEFVKKCNMSDVLLYYKPINSGKYIFYNARRSVSPTEIEQKRESELYSVIIIKPQEKAVIRRNVSPFDGRISYVANFVYNGVQYNNISVTDTALIDICNNEHERSSISDFPLKESSWFVVSIGGVPFSIDNQYYKFVAARLLAE